MIQIRLIDIPEQVSPSLLSDGYLYLDLNDSFDIIESKQITELTPDNDFKISYTVSSDLDLTPRNYEALKGFLLVTIDPEYRAAVPVHIQLSSSIKTDVNLYVKQLNVNRVQIEFTFSDSEWIKNISGKKLKDVYKNPDLDDQFHTATLIDTLKSKNDYVDGDIGIYPIIADWGRHRKTIPTSYVRWVHHVLPLMRDIFCEAGLEFSSPFFESEIGRKQVDYLIDPNFGTYLSDDVQDFDAERRVEAIHEIGGHKYLTNTVQALTTQRIVQFPLVVHNDMSHMESDYYGGTANAEVNINVALYGEVKDLRPFVVTGGQNVGASYFPRFNIVRFNALTGEIIDIIHKFDEIRVEGKFSFEVELKGISLVYYERVGVFFDDPIRFPNSAGQIERYTEIELFPKKTTGSDDEEKFSSFRVEGVRRYLFQNDSFSVMNLINPDIDVLKYVKEKSRQFNLKWWYNPVEARIYAAQPYQVKILDQDIEGFMIETDIEDIIEKIDQSKPKVSNPPLSQARYVELSFKESTDPEVTNKMLYSAKIDLGEKYTLDQSTEFKLDIFEPTKQKIVGGRRPRPNVPSSEISGYEVCVMRSEEDVEHHYNIQPRSLIAWGESVHGSVDQGTRTKIILNGVETDVIPTVLQMGGLLDGAVPKFALIFGYDDALRAEHPLKELDWNLWELNYKRDTIEQLDTQKLDYLTSITRNEFQNFNFRNLYMIQHFGRPVTVRMTAINNFINRSSVATPITYIPFKFINNICDIDVSDPQLPPPPPFNGCNNNVYIEVSENFSCQVFTIMGEVGSYIESVWFEISDDDGETWLTIFNSSMISAQRCSAGGDYLVRATVFFGDLFGETCEDQLIGPISISVCHDPSYWSIECSISFESSLGMCAGFLVNVDPLFAVEFPLGIYTVEDKEYSFDNENFYEFNPNGGLLCGITDDIIYFRATIIANGCEPFVITSSCNVEGNCSQNEPTLKALPNGQGCYVLIKGGFLYAGLGEEAYDDYILVRIKNEAGEWGAWVRWDSTNVVCDACFQAKRVILFCDDLCPIACSPIIEQCCEIFDAGEPTNTAFCNDGLGLVV